jgi:hypothetical protein
MCCDDDRDDKEEEKKGGRGIWNCVLPKIRL